MLESSQQTFDAFGSRTAHTGTGDSLFGFTGNWTDPDTGLVHLRARDYDPVTGQFLSVDPVVDATRQPYAYTGNSPLQRTDPSGLDWIQDVYDGAVDALMAAAQGSNCFLEQATAFGAGALDSLTFGASSIILGAVVPGYDEFVAGHEAAFTAGSIAATVIQTALIVIGTAGAGAGLAVGLIVLKNVVKSAVKSVVKSVERAGVRAAERAGVRAAERTGMRSAERVGESCANSFTAGTLVLMADGTQKPIEDVEVGDEVLATDPESGVTMARPVVGLIDHDGEHAMVELTFDDDTELTATDEHPFWDVTAGAFVYAEDLRVGDQVLTADGHTLTVTGTKTYVESLTAYNLSIAGIHTYYAGNTPILVHNCPTASGEPVFRGTNMSDEMSFQYHYDEHGAPAGVTPEQYLSDAQSWARSPSGGGKPVELRNGESGTRYRPNNAPGGIMDLAGDIISFWYRP